MPEGGAFVPVGDAVLRQELADNGAAMVGFQQDGAGALSRDLQEKVRETLSVTDYPIDTAEPYDDTDAVEAALNLALITGRPVEFPFERDMYITRPIDLTPKTAPSTYTGEVGIHFTRARSVLLQGQGGYAIKAAPNFVGDYMLQFIFNSGNGWIAPQWSSVKDIIIDGSNIASTAIISNYCMNVEMNRVRITGVNTAFKWIGYGVARINRCSVFADVCVDFSEGGGDSWITECDLYPKSRGVLIGASGANCTVRDNVMTRQDADFLPEDRYIGVASSEALADIRHVRIINNEFCGAMTAISFTGDSTGRAWQLDIDGNHLTPSAGGAEWTGALAYLENCQEVKIRGNGIGSSFLGYPANGASSQAGINLVRCYDTHIYGNNFSRLEGPAVIASNSNKLMINSNVISNVGTAGSGAIYLDSVNFSSISNNVGYADGAVTAKIMIQEAGTSSGNKGVGNIISGNMGTLSELAPGSTSVYS